MKKIIAMILALGMMVSLSACENTPSNTTENTTTAAPIVQTTTGDSTPTTTPPETTAAPIVTPPFVDNFNNFLHLDGEEKYVGKATLIPETRWGGSDATPPFVLIQIVGIDHIEDSLTIYRVKMVEAFGFDGIEPNRVFLMAWRGTAKEYLYGRPPMEIGKIYGKFMPNLSTDWMAEDHVIQAGLMYDIQEIEGERYIYGFGMDLSFMNCKIEITDPEENNIFKSGKHDKAIAALEADGMKMPTFDYKCEINEFYAECEQRCP